MIGAVQDLTGVAVLGRASRPKKARIRTVLLLPLLVLANEAAHPGLAATTWVAEVGTGGTVVVNRTGETPGIWLVADTTLEDQGDSQDRGITATDEARQWGTTNTVAILDLASTASAAGLRRADSTVQRITVTDEVMRWAIKGTVTILDLASTASAADLRTVDSTVQSIMATDEAMRWDITDTVAILDLASTVSAAGLHTADSTVRRIMATDEVMRWAIKGTVAIRDLAPTAIIKAQVGQASAGITTLSGNDLAITPPAAGVTTLGMATRASVIVMASVDEAGMLRDPGMDTSSGSVLAREPEADTADSSLMAVLPNTVAAGAEVTASRATAPGKATAEVGSAARRIGNLVPRSAGLAGNRLDCR